MPEYSMEVVQEGPAVSFLLSSEAGPVRAVSIAVVHPARKQFLWVLHSANSSKLFLAEMDPALEQQARAEAERSTTPEFRAFAEKLYGSTVNRAIDRITYGEVPPGFVQGYPTGAQPQALGPGVAYTLCLWGAYCGSRSFKVRKRRTAAERAVSGLLRQARK